MLWELIKVKTIGRKNLKICELESNFEDKNKANENFIGENQILFVSFLTKFLI